MFQIKKTEYINKTFRIPVDLASRLEVLAQRNNVSLNNLIVQCCDYALKNIDESKISKDT